MGAQAGLVAPRTADPPARVNDSGDLSARSTDEAVAASVARLSSLDSRARARRGGSWAGGLSAGVTSVLTCSSAFGHVVALVRFRFCFRVLADVCGGVIVGDCRCDHRLHCVGRRIGSALSSARGSAAELPVSCSPCCRGGLGGLERGRERPASIRVASRSSVSERVGPASSSSASSARSASIRNCRHLGNRTSSTCSNGLM